MSQLEDLLQQCTVKLSLPGRMGWGTGFFVAPGWVLTCAHVVQGANGEPVQVWWQQRELSAMVERSLPSPYDLALLQVACPSDVDPPCVYLDEEIRSRDPLYLFGYPDEGDRQGEPRTFNCDGITGSEIASILFNLGQVRPGMSGSPLLNQRTGRVCGTVKFTRDRSINLGGGAIPTRVILEQFPELRELQREFHNSDRRWSNLVVNLPQSNPLISFNTLRSRFQTYLQELSNDCPDWWLYEINESTWYEFELFTKVDAKPVQPEKSLSDEEPVQPEKSPSKVLEPILKAIHDSKNRAILVTGEPGAGKSTLLEKLAVEAAREAQQDAKEPIPVLVRLKDYTAVGERPGIRGLIQASLESYDPSLDVEAMNQLLRSKQILLLVDGWNELSDEQTKSKIKTFFSPYAVIVTSRNTGDYWEIHQRLEIQPLSSVEVKRFFEQRLPGSERNQLQVLVERVKDFGQTPLMVWMLYSIFKATNSTPETRGEAYYEFTKLYAERAKEGIDLTDTRVALGQLAFNMMQSRKPTDLTDFALDIAEVDARRLLSSESQLKKLQNHLLRWQGKGNSKISFCHQSLQEYYAAEHLLEQLSQHPEWLEKENAQEYTHFQKVYLNYVKWTEPAALLLGLIDSETQALRIIQQALDVDLMLGARFAGEVRHGLQNQTVSLIDDSENPLKFKIQLFGLTKSLAALPFLSQSLDNGDNFVRGESIRAVTKINSIHSINLLRKALNDQDPKNRWLAAYELAKLGDATGIPVLQDALYDKEHHINALFSIAKLTPEKVIPLLDQVFRDGSSEARLKATTSLHLLLSKGYEGILPLSEIVPLLEIALHDEASQVRYAAAHALMNAGSGEALSILSQAWADQGKRILKCS